MKYLMGIVCCMLLSVFNYAQDTAVVKEAATGLRADGKIYVVVAVVVTLLLGLVIYLISLDRKISRLEK
ncbi:MAG: CcmD family protein [Chitinophagaceae bacterium]|nr:CcmD family protein [Chitinophagaceae bacterium]